MSTAHGTARRVCVFAFASGSCAFVCRVGDSSHASAAFGLVWFGLVWFSLAVVWLVLWVLCWCSSLVWLATLDNACLLLGACYLVDLCLFFMAKKECADFHTAYSKASMQDTYTHRLIRAVSR